MNSQLRILFVTAEVSPFARTGGLGDVCGALPQALAALGHDVRIVMPLYKAIRDQAVPMTEVPGNLDMPLVFGTRQTRVWQGQLDTPTANDDPQSWGPRVPVYFIEHDEYYNRSGLYGGEAGDYADNAFRFLFLSHAAIALPGLLSWFPHIFHCHDWHAALVPAYLRFLPECDPRLAASGTIFTIHNLAYQGRFPSWVFDITGLPHSLFHTAGLEFYGGVNFMKAGIYYADYITAVSPTYAQEIATAEGGFGLDGVLRERRDVVRGILNGTDTKAWSPQRDPHIVKQYSANDIQGKARCKAELLRLFAFPDDPTVPVLAFISRLVDQKGVDLLIGGLGQLLALRLRLVVLGSGEVQYQRMLSEWAERYPEQIAVRYGFDDALAHRIQAGSDMLLMPSLYEPCGLTQLYSLRYGTIPIVRAVGGLKDTVIPFDPESNSGTGFTFTDPTSDALVASVRTAVQTFADRKRWHALMYRAMQQEFSWDRSAAQYVTLYRDAAVRRADAGPPQIAFGTSGWRAIVAEEFTHDRVAAVARAVADHVREEQGQPARLLIAHDTRFLGREFAETAAQSCVAAGVQVEVATTPLPTPVVAFEVIRRRLSGAVNITASHNLYRWNGLKFSPAWGGPALPETTRDIARRANGLLANGYVERGSATLAREHGRWQDVEVGDAYRHAVAQLIDVDCLRHSQITVAVDLLWGTAAGFLDRLLEQSGVLGPVFHAGCDPYFGNGRPEPIPETMSEMIARLQEGGLTLGVGCDCDADRFGICDRDGTFFAPNLILPLVADYLITHRKLTGKIGRSVATSHLMDAVAQYHGLEVVETPVGFKYLGEMIVRGELLLGGEESGGLSIRGHIPEKDGILACLLVAEMVARTGKSLKVLLQELFVRVGELHPLREDIKLSAAQQSRLRTVLASPPTSIAGIRVERVSTLDGLKLYLHGGSWVLIRASGTEPVVRLYAEAGRQEMSQLLLSEAQQLFLTS
ncbi:MAG: glycogen synthase GlgA [Deltaproteobacteria bacterium]|nr:glycogen synthase GlgA [Deltaproteobacteria bacterium]